MSTSRSELPNLVLGTHEQVEALRVTILAALVNSTTSSRKTDHLGAEAPRPGRQKPKWAANVSR
jgi:hypothetical protein